MTTTTTKTTRRGNWTKVGGIVWIIPSGTSEGQQKDNSQDKRELHSRKSELGIVYYLKLTGRELG